jgi:hypothetical protein
MSGMSLPAIYVPTAAPHWWPSTSSLLWYWYPTTILFEADDSGRALYQVNWSDSVQVASDVHSPVSCQIEDGLGTPSEIESRDSLLPGYPVQGKTQ